jgi:ubiquinone/menaquinone biosynthesis C-methylase UbiE
LSGKSLLDIGCGVGRVAAFVKERSIGKYYGVDLSPEMVTACQRRFKGQEGFVFEVGDAEQIALPEKSFDVIVSYGLFEYVDKVQPYLSEVCRLLKHEGMFLFTVHTRFGANLCNKRFGEYERVGWTKEDIVVEAHKSGFSIESVRPIFNSLSRIRGIVRHTIPGELLQCKSMICLATLDGWLSRITPENAISYVLTCTRKR